MSYDPNEFQRHHQSAIKDREADESQARMRTAFFVAVLGPLGIAVLAFFKPEFKDWMRWGIYGTMPLSVLLLIVSFVRAPGASRFNGKVLLFALLTLAAAASTWPLCRQFLPQ